MWTVKTTPVFDEWLAQQETASRIRILASMTALATLGHNLGRPLVDTVEDSKFSNMKELRTKYAGHQYRALFAFDPLRQAIVLCAGDKTGQNQKLFYKDLIQLADELYQQHLDSFKGDK